MSPFTSSTPIPRTRTQEIDLNNHAQSSSECSTPSVINQPRSSSISQQPTTRPLIAK
ncbi:unnamed protein product, partial [Rotaria magnacalcarata]